MFNSQFSSERRSGGMCTSRPARLMSLAANSMSRSSNWSDSRSCLASVEHFAIRHPFRMRIKHWELSIGQIPGRFR